MHTKKDTRELLLDSAFTHFYKQGYQGANIAAILNDVGINKGSMYYFFKSKKELALSVIQERLKRDIKNKYDSVFSYEKATDCEEILKKLFDILRAAPDSLMYGCPLNKMTQEMLYIDDDFKQILSEVYFTFENSITNILIHAKIKNPRFVTRYIISTYEGALMIYHLKQNREEFKEIMTRLEIECYSNSTKHYIIKDQSSKI